MFVSKAGAYSILKANYAPLCKFSKKYFEKHTSLLAQASATKKESCMQGILT